MTEWDLNPVSESPPYVIVEKLRAQVELVLTEEYLRNFDLSVIQDRVANRLRFQLRTEVWGQRLAPEVTSHNAEWHETRWASWWDHFKDTYRQRWWLRALVRRRPVRYVDIPHSREITLTVESYRTFPEANFHVPDEFGPVVYQQNLRTEEEWHPW